MNRLGSRYINIPITSILLDEEEIFNELVTFSQKKTGKYRFENIQSVIKHLNSKAPIGCYFGKDEYGYIGFWEIEPSDNDAIEELIGGM